MQLDVPVEVEGIRLIADLVAAGAGIAVLPETAVPPVLDGLRTFAIADLPPRQLGLATLKNAPLSLADRAVRDAVLEIVGWTRRGAIRESGDDDGHAGDGQRCAASRRSASKRSDRRPAAASSTRMRPPPGHASSVPVASSVVDARRRAGRAKKRDRVAARSGLPSTTCRSVTGSAPARRAAPATTSGCPTAPCCSACGSTVGDRAVGRSVCASWTTVPCASRGWRNASCQSRVVEADADRRDARGAARVEHRGEVRHLERDVVRAAAVAGEEAREEVVVLGPPHDERLDRSCPSVAVPTRVCTQRKP